ncbi:MAG TPA: histidine--tRNA ligase [Thermoanaerobaculia bacterium]|nr:histidine--tRNA ligase [Thermoanaerobaculia bacterium]
MTKYAALPGFRDFYPDEMARRRQIFHAWRDAAIRFGFDEYDGPPLEALDLYVDKSGPEIVNQLFNFTDKGGREVALRPEMTPTLVRMLGARIKGMPRPIRWFSTPQLFRYEKQQRGRLREHFQLNMDIIGEESVLADADLLAAALDVLQSLGLTSDDIVARYSDRRLLHHALVELGVREEDLPTAYNVIDKVERDPRDICLKRLAEIGLAREQAEAALSLTEASDASLHERFGDSKEVGHVLQELETYRAALTAFGFGHWIEFDMKIVRGLAYYTGIVFEIFDRKGTLRAICGGGRYDKLFLTLTGMDVPALGFGFGDVVLGELLKDRGLAAAHKRSVDVCVISDADATETALRVAGWLRSSGKSVIFSYKGGDVGKQLKYAAANGAEHAIIVPKEIGAESIGITTYRVRDLAGSTQSDLTLTEYLVKYPPEARR